MTPTLGRPDIAAAPALAEVALVAEEIAELGEVEQRQAPVALILDYASAWAWEAQPQGADFDYFRLVFSAYRALRRAGLDVDVLPPDASDLSGYALVLAPGILSVDATLKAAIARAEGLVLLGPRTDTKTVELSIADPMGPDIAGLDLTVVLSESLPPGADIPLIGGGAFIRWFEHLEGDAEAKRRTESGQPAIAGAGHLRYLAGWPNDETFFDIVTRLAREAGLRPRDLPDGLRLRKTAHHRFVFNYSSEPQDWEGTTLPPAGILWEEI